MYVWQFNGEHNNILSATMDSRNLKENKQKENTIIKLHENDLTNLFSRFRFIYLFNFLNTVHLQSN